MKGPDLNDLHREKGEEAVRTASDSARSFEPDDFGPDEQAHAEGNGEADGEWEPPRNPWTVPVLSWRDPETIPRRVFLYGHCYARGFVSATIADGGVGKSLFKIVEFLACATRRPLLGITPTERIRVLYWNGDDPMSRSNGASMPPASTTASTSRGCSPKVGCSWARATSNRSASRR